MLSEDFDKYILNVKLASYTGLYQMINPPSKTRTVLGQNVYHVTVMAYAVYIAVLLAFIPVGLYRRANNTNEFFMGLILFVNYFFSIYKVLTVMRNSRKISDCVEVTRVDFLASYAGYRPDALEKCSARSLKITYAYSACCYIVLLFWYVIPFAVRNAHVTVRYRDGTQYDYRLNVHNLYVPMISSQTYNEYFTGFYVIEVAFGMCYIIFTVMFDNFVVSTCLAISSQIETVGEAYESLGYKLNTIRSTNDDNHSKMNASNEVLLDFKMITKDYQIILKKLQDYYTIVRSIILTQIFVDSSTLICLSFIIALNYTRGSNDSVYSIQSLKMFSAIPVCIFQLFSTCYLFGNIHNKIDSTNTTIYSSNWTEMDLKYKKLVLLKLNMNNATKMKLKMTVTKIIDLELFIDILHACYSILSVMVNSKFLNSTN